MAEDLATFAESLGVEPEAINFLYDCPDEIQSTIVSTFDGSGSKDGNVLGRLQGYTRHLLKRSGSSLPESLGAPPPKESKRSDSSAELADFARRVDLSAEGEQFLSRLPQEVVATVVKGFDPSGTKDGNVWGRFLGYARSHWATFFQIDRESASYLRSLPEEAQLTVMMDFDGASKDGSNGSRLVRFIQHLQRKGLISAASEPTGGHSLAQARAPPPVRAQAGWFQGAGRNGNDNRGILDFARRMNLDGEATAFLQDLEPEVISIVISKFDPSGTKDGNVWGRLLGYIRHNWCRYHQVDQATISHMRSLPEHEQMNAMLDSRAHSWQSHGRARHQESHRGAPQAYDNRSAAPGGFRGGLSVEQFSRQWQLNGYAQEFVKALPHPVRDAVMRGFDGSTSKDGNVWGRLLGYSRQAWVRHLGLDRTMTAQLKDMPEEAQLMCITRFDASQSKDGNIAGRLQAYMNRCLRQAGHSQAHPTGRLETAHVEHRHHQAFRHSAADTAGEDLPTRTQEELADDPAVLSFLERCQLDTSAVDCLQHLPDDLLHQVLEGFDPSGTKDGNVIGRLQGYVKSLARKRGLALDADCQPVKRARTY